MEGHNINQMSLVGAIMKELARQVPGITAEARYFNAVIKAANDICAELARPVVKATKGMGLEAWLNSDDTGSSSLYMAWCLNGGIHGEWPLNIQPAPAYPHDPDDLGRCIRLIEAVHEFGGMIPEMSHRGPEWQAVTTNWAEWVDLYNNTDGEELYQRMKDAGL